MPRKNPQEFGLGVRKTQAALTSIYSPETVAQPVLDDPSKVVSGLASLSKSVAYLGKQNANFDKGSMEPLAEFVHDQKVANPNITQSELDRAVSESGITSGRVLSKVRKAGGFDNLTDPAFRIKYSELQGSDLAANSLPELLALESSLTQSLAGSGIDLKESPELGQQLVDSAILGKVEEITNGLDPIAKAAALRSIRPSIAKLKASVVDGARAERSLNHANMTVTSGARIAAGVSSGTLTPEEGSAEISRELREAKANLEPRHFALAVERLVDSIAPSVYASLAASGVSLASPEGQAEAQEAIEMFEKALESGEGSHLDLSAAATTKLNTIKSSLSRDKYDIQGEMNRRGGNDAKKAAKRYTSSAEFFELSPVELDSKQQDWEIRTGNMSPEEEAELAEELGVSPDNLYQTVDAITARYKDRASTRRGIRGVDGAHKNATEREARMVTERKSKDIMGQVSTIVERTTHEGANTEELVALLEDLSADESLSDTQRAQIDTSISSMQTYDASQRTSIIQGFAGLGEVIDAATGFTATSVAAEVDGTGSDAEQAQVLTNLRAGNATLHDKVSRSAAASFMAENPSVDPKDITVEMMTPHINDAVDAIGEQYILDLAELSGGGAAIMAARENRGSPAIPPAFLAFSEDQPAATEKLLEYANASAKEDNDTRRSVGNAVSAISLGGGATAAGFFKPISVTVEGGRLMGRINPNAQDLLDSLKSINENPELSEGARREISSQILLAAGTIPLEAIADPAVFLEMADSMEAVMKYDASKFEGVKHYESGTPQGATRSAFMYDEFAAPRGTHTKRTDDSKKITEGVTAGADALVNFKPPTFKTLEELHAAGYQFLDTRSSGGGLSDLLLPDGSLNRKAEGFTEKMSTVRSALRVMVKSYGTTTPPDRDVRDFLYYQSQYK